MLKDKRILLIIGGGIAAYKTLDLIRRLRERGANVRAILTKGGTEFITPLSVSSLTGEKVYSDLFDLTDEAEMGHIQLSRDADILLVAPATAHLLARMTGGLADDLATTALLATDKPILVAPAMNVRMWQHAATQRNVSQLKEDGVTFIGPTEGDMACGEHGPGRLAEPLEIVEALEAYFSSGPNVAALPDLGHAPDHPMPLADKHVLVTAGPTHEPIDPVRYIANRSSGKQGYAIADALASLGAQVTLVSGPVTLPEPEGVDVCHVETAQEMLRACETALPVDVAICAAAVADWRVDSAADNKIKKTGKEIPDLKLTENPDILRALSLQLENRPKLVIGFAAETENVIEHAKQKLKRKGCDWIVANDVSPETGIMGGDVTTVHLLSDQGEETWAGHAKTKVAETLAWRIATFFHKDNVVSADLNRKNHKNKGTNSG